MELGQELIAGGVWIWLALLGWGAAVVLAWLWLQARSRSVPSNRSDVSRPPQPSVDPTLGAETAEPSLPSAPAEIDTSAQPEMNPLGNFRELADPLQVVLAEFANMDRGNSREGQLRMADALARIQDILHQRFASEREPTTAKRTPAEDLDPTLGVANVQLLLTVLETMLADTPRHRTKLHRQLDRVEIRFAFDGRSENPGSDVDEQRLSVDRVLSIAHSVSCRCEISFGSEVRGLISVPSAALSRMESSSPLLRDLDLDRGVG